MATGLDFRTDEGTQADDRLNPAINRKLYNQEEAAGQAAEHTSDTDNGTATRNIDSAKDQERTGGWKSNVSDPSENNQSADGNGGGKKAKAPIKLFKQKGPLGLILGLLGGGGILGTALAAPSAAVIAIKEAVVNKLDSMSASIEARGDEITKNRMFSTNATCTVKIRCRFSGLNEKQMQRLRVQGAELLDVNGKPVEKNFLGHYTGGKTLILPDKTSVTADNYLKTLGSNKDLRDLSRIVFPSRWMSFNGAAAKSVRALRKLITNPSWGEDDKSARQDVAKATAGDSYTAQSQPPSASDQYTTDSNGNQVPKNPNQTTLPMGDVADAANKVAEADQATAFAGDPLPDLPSDPAGAAIMPESAASVSIGKKIVGFLNPTDILVGLCGTYKLANTMVDVTRIAVLAEDMRLASQFLSTADKIKAGDGTSGEAQGAMDMMEAPDQYGDAFGDSVGYQYTTYGTVPDKPLTSSALGNGVIQVLAAVIHWLNHAIGKTTIKDGCNFLTNPFVQGALALTSFIPGGGQIVGAIKTAISTAAKAAAEQTIKEMVANLVKAAAEKVAANITKNALKNAAKVATKEFLKVAAGAGGIFLASYLTERYAIPYLGRVLAGVLVPANGVEAMDTVANGFDAINQETAQTSGFAPLQPSQVSAFNEFNDKSNATYIADMRSESNPFDLNNPYSAGNSLASTFYTFASKVKNSSLLSAPAAILSSLNLGSFFGGNTALADSPGVYQNCQQDDFISSTGLATTPFCNIMMGPNDIGMLENEDPDQLTQWMISNNQIDGNGTPIPNSDYATFQSECPVVDKQFMDVGDPDKQISPDCYNLSKVNSDNWKHFYIYDIDLGITDDMDNDQASTSSDQTSSTAPSYIAVGNIPASGTTVGASVFGGTLSNGQWVQNLADNGGNDLGDHGNHMTGTPAFAELQMGKALGGIPDGTRLEISYNGKSIIAEKADIGAGGADVNGHTRAIDLWWQTANLLGVTDGTAVVTIHAVDPGTPLSQVATTGNSSLKNIGFSLGQVLTDYRPFMSYARGAF